MLGHCVIAVFAASRKVSTRGRQKRRYEALVSADQEQDEALHQPTPSCFRRRGDNSWAGGKADADRPVEESPCLAESVEVVRCLTRLVAQQMSAADKRLQGGRQFLKRCIPGWCPRNDHEVAARAYLASKRAQHLSDSPLDEVPCHRVPSRPSYNDTDLWWTFVPPISDEQYE